MSFPNLPWEHDYKGPAADQNLLQDITGAVENTVNEVTQGVTGVASGMAGAVAGQAAAQAVQAVGGMVSAGETAAEQIGAAVAPDVLPTATRGPSSAPASAPGGGIGALPGMVASDLGSAIKNAALAAAERTALAAVPDLEREAAAMVESMVGGELKKVVGAHPTPTISLSDLTKASARSRALRSLFIGMFMAVLMGLASIIGQLGGVDWFTTTGRLSAVTLAVGAIVHSLISYVARLQWEPAYTQTPVAVAPPPGG